jgi:hypothetical protein
MKERTKGFALPISLGQLSWRGLRMNEFLNFELRFLIWGRMGVWLLVTKTL